jgi:hypothetical protein
MIKKLMFAAVLMAVCLSASAGAGESDNWKSETGATNAKKILDFVLHSDGNVYGIAHDAKIYKRDTAGKSWSEVAYSLPTTTAGGRPSAKRVLDTAWRSSVRPQLISFKTKLYTAVQYKIYYCPNDGYKHYTYPELDIIEIDPASAAVTIRMQLRGGAAYSWSNHCTFPAIQTSKNTMLDGYIFKDTDLDGPGGATMYWGGGGVKPITPVETLTTLPLDFTKGTTDFRYVHSTTDALTWTVMDRRAKDQYERAIPRAMPNGYRNNHLIDFKGVLWDYYGYYAVDTNLFAAVTCANKLCTAFSPTPKLSGTVPGLAGTHKILTEPWSRFQMGAGDADGTGDQLLRIGFTPKGDKNFICSITGTGGSWADFHKSNGDAAWDGPDNGGLVYWRGCTVVKNTDDLAVGEDTNDPKYNETFHNGLYATYSKKIAAGSYESGVFRYANVDTDTPSDGVANGWAWSKVTSINSATVYTGAIFVQKNDPADPNKGVILVGTSSGVITRGIGRLDLGDDNAEGGAGADADTNPMPK